VTDELKMIARISRVAAMQADTVGVATITGKNSPRQQNRLLM
jgi:hypothetical protein